MPSKDKVNKTSRRSGTKTRPFTVFFVDPDTPEEVHTGTVMARDCEDAMTRASTKFGAKSILHIRGIGDPALVAIQEDSGEKCDDIPNHLPCARFIKGEFRLATSNDDPFLEALTE